MLKKKKKNNLGVHLAQGTISASFNLTKKKKKKKNSSLVPSPTLSGMLAVKKKIKRRSKVLSRFFVFGDFFRVGGGFTKNFTRLIKNLFICIFVTFLIVRNKFRGGEGLYPPRYSLVQEKLSVLLSS